MAKRFFLLIFLFFPHHINLIFVHHDASTQQEGEHELVLLEQAAAHVAVEAKSEVLINVDDALLQSV